MTTTSPTPTFPESHQDLLTADVATFITVGPAGLPQATAVGFLSEDGALKLSLPPIGSGGRMAGPTCARGMARASAGSWSRSTRSRST